MFADQRPTCSYDEIALVSARRRSGRVSMEKAADALRNAARSLGGDAIIAVRLGSTQVATGAGTTPVTTTADLSGTVVRFRDRGCRGARTAAP